MAAKKITFIGVPLDLGAGRRGVDMGPSAFRVAEIHSRVRALGYEVADRGDIDVFIQETRDAGDPRMKYLTEIRHTCEAVRDEVDAILGEGAMPVVLGGDLNLLAPVVEGRIDIKNGVIPVPEQPRKLHAVSGKALLWQTGNRTAADSTLAKALEAKDAATDTTGKFRPVYDLQVVVPSGLWIRGRNLNVELEGDLRLRQQHSIPTVVGNLEARQGTLNFVGRSFSLERGKVQFYGEDEINPGLDIRLSAKISSTTAYVTMSGTLKEPKVELTSSPSMSEADIMSLLVMGKTADDLNGDQAQLVAQRAAAVAATYGAAELQKKMAGPLGVDMITLNPGGGPEGENSVVVGKYLSPRALLKYEQALDSAAGFFVTLEYTLTQTITLQTIAGTWQSGAEISWSKDY
jgi:autotransporter translocation and assembly factor TamB